MEKQVRQTSKDAYFTIKQSGLLSKRRFQVYEIIYLYGPMTLNQILKIAQRQIKVLNTGSYSGRLSELERMGLITPVGTTIDSTTDHKAILWQTTENLPKKLPKFKSEKQLMRELLVGLKNHSCWCNRDGMGIFNHTDICLQVQDWNDKHNT